MTTFIDPDELPYRADALERVAEVADLRVVVLTLSQGQEVPWHYHSSMADTFYCLAGPMQIEHGSPERRVVLSAGESHQVPPRTRHRVAGVAGGPCRFLIVQGIGPYDFVPSAP